VVAMRIRRRSFGLQVTVLLLTGIVVLARYWYNVGFDQKYRQLLSDELARYGLGAEIGRMTIDPVAGLIARDVELFDLKQPELKLAGINRIALDVDLARLVNKEDFLRSITLTRAHLSLPVDPGDPESEWIRVSDLNARLVIRGRQIEIASAEANLAGLHISMRGEVTRAAPSGKPSDPEEEKRKREQQLREMRDRRGALRTVLRILDRFKVPDGPDGLPRSSGLATVELEVQGDLSDLDTARVHATLQGGPVRCGNFEALEYSADAVLEDGELTLRRLNVADAMGTFSATASWKIRQSDRVEFAVDSSVDLLSLLHGAAPGAVARAHLPDTVTAGATPRFRANGALLTGRPFTLERPPVNVTGFVTSGAFTVKGETYEGLHADFALRDDGFVYLRNVNIKHPAGSLRGQFMRRAEDMRYEFSLDAGMAALAPLLDIPNVQKPLTPVAWDAQSRVKADFSGTGSADGLTWNHRGTVDTRDYRLRGALVRQFHGDIEVGPGRMPVITVRDFLVRREDGDITGKEVIIDQPAALLHVKGIASSCMPSPAAAMFAPRTGEALARYYFESPPRTELEGTIGLKSPEGNDVRVKLLSPGVCGLPVGKQDWRFTGVSGTIHLKKDIVGVELSGRSLPRGKFTEAVRFDSPASMSISGVFGITKENWVSATKYAVNVEAPENMRLLLAEREFPIQRLNATVRNDAGRLAVLAGGSLYEGRLAATLDFPDQSKGGHSATVTLDRINFSSLTALFGSKDETGGMISGRFSYQTPDGNGPTIEGSGAAGLEEGNIFALPLLGPLSTVISALLPGDRIAYSVARKATATFTVNRGRVTMRDFEAATRTFRLTADGVIDILRDGVDLNARVNLRGAPGLLLYPVSKLFEYRAAGSINDPGWRPKILPRMKRGRDEVEEE
jgi:hypothetical protein